jgi:hypothetical protein
MKTSKGCVYFFKHVGLNPVKIGYSENESPINRFEQFKTYAPFGAELIGFIRTVDSKKLETELHQKYSRDRIKGEWFEISLDEVKKCISFYSNLQDIEEINNFQVAFAKHLVKNNGIETDDFFKLFSLYEIPSYKKVCLSQYEISYLLKQEKSVVKKILEENNLFIKAHRFENKIKKGYLLYLKQEKSVTS